MATVSEVWLFPNQRVYWAALVPAAVVAAVLLIVSIGMGVVGWWWGCGLAAVGAIGCGWLAGSLLFATRRPRLAFGADQLWVYLEGEPIGVPIEIVECFFLGQGPSFLPKVDGKEPETQNIIVRLAESAVDWKHRDLHDDKLAHWCEGYITLRGAWCEPITRERMQQLNHRLAEIHRARKAQAAAAKAAQDSKPTSA